MTTVYRCDVCGEEFVSSWVCYQHEEQHFDGDDRVKYQILHNPREDLCDYCAKSYYVYGCEKDCEMKECSVKNNYKDFVAVVPLHNKRMNGGV